MKNKGVQALVFIIVSIIIILFVYIKFAQNKNEINNKPAATLPGISIPAAVDMTANTKTWSEAINILPKNFPEIIINDSSNFSNIVSQYSKVSITWSNYTLEYQTQIQIFLENELDTAFVQNSDVITAYGVKIGKSTYDLTLSHTNAIGESLELVTLGISPAS